MLLAYRTAVLADRPVLYAPLWEPVTPSRDLVNRSPNSTDTGALVRGMRGPLGDASISFPSTVGNRVAFPDATFLDLTDLWSIECWIFPTVAQAAGGTWISKGQGAYCGRVIGAGANAQCDALRSNVAVLRSSPQNLPYNTRWFHVVATKNGTARFIYVNANDVSTGGANSTCINNANTLDIGSDASGGIGSYFGNWIGLLAHAAVYNYVLSKAQILAHYTAGRYRV